MLNYEQVLRSGVGLIVSSDHVSRDEWKTYIKGFVFAPFRVDDLMNGILDDISNDVKFELYDSDSVKAVRLMFDSDKQAHFDNPEACRLSSELPLDMRGRSWTLFFETEPSFIHAGEGLNSLIVAFGGLTVDILLFLIIAIVGRQRKRAITLASDMTHDLRRSEHFNRSILDNASEAMVVAKNGVITIFNAAAELTFGRSSSGVIGKEIDSLLQMPSWKSLRMLFEAGATWSPSDRLLRGIRIRINEPLCLLAKNLLSLRLSRRVQISDAKSLNPIGSREVNGSPYFTPMVFPQ